MKDKVVVGSAKGWDMVQPGQPKDPFGAQVVKDHRQALERNGNPLALEHYESLKGNKAKVDFALSLTLRRDDLFPSAMETRKCETLDSG